MSIQILSGSFEEHRTIDSTEVKTMYIMDWLDYYNGIGDLYDGEWNFLYVLYLPWIGDNFSIYYNTNYLNKLVLVDISMETTDGITLPFNSNGQDYDKKIIVTYTWSNQDGAADTKVENESASWIFTYNTTLESGSTATYIDNTSSPGVKINWADKYLTEKNPDLVLSSDEVGYSPVKYNSDTDIRKQIFRNETDIVPELISRKTNMVLEIKAYSNFIITQELALGIGKVNNDDLLSRTYTKKEEALIAKNKLPGYDANDFLNQNDAGLWQFIDFDMNDMGNGFFEYTYYLEYNKYGWNNYVEDNLTFVTGQYETTNFYNLLLSGMDKTSPNIRIGR